MPDRLPGDLVVLCRHSIVQRLGTNSEEWCQSDAIGLVLGRCCDWTHPFDDGIDPDSVVVFVCSTERDALPRGAYRVHADRLRAHSGHAG